MARFKSVRTVPAVFWALTVIAIVAWALVPGYVVGWDLDVYKNAMASLRLGHDPYLDGIAVQRIFHALPFHDPNVSTPFTYVYSPITLPPLRWLAHFPIRAVDAVYWCLYFPCAFVPIWVGLRALEHDVPANRTVDAARTSPNERTVFAFLAPVIIFFPGLLQNDVLFSGNVAYLLYALMLTAALVGWRRHQWAWFYIAVLLASCFKAPLLCFVVIPALSARRQWAQTALTAVVGVALFAVQPHIWPAAFHNFLQAVELQFSFNHDFSSSPAGLAAGALYNVAPYALTSTLFYLLYAVPVFLILWKLSLRYFAGAFSLRQWIPVLFVGAALLNPRIMEYDLAPITTFLALIAWRFFARNATLRRTIVAMALFFAAINIAAYSWPGHSWRLTAGLTLLTVFAAGAWNLFATARRNPNPTQPWSPTRDPLQPAG